MNNNGDAGRIDSGARSHSGADALWQAAGVLLRRRWFIVGTAAFVAVASVVITLMMPNIYEASVRVLAPERGSGGLFASALMKNLPGAAAGLLGGRSSDYNRYLTILSSRALHDDVIEHFDLTKVYDVAEKKHPMLAARKQLERNLTLDVDAEYEFLAVRVRDESPERAAEMANYFVRRMNEMNAALATESAGSYRQFIEVRYEASIAATDSVLDAMKAFQERYGLFDVTAQTESFFEQVGGLRAAAIEAEIQHETLAAQLGPNNSQVQALRQAAAAANRKYQDALNGQEAVLPVPRAEVANVMRQYMDLQRESIMQARILEVVRPLLEQARLEEQQKVEAVQIVDPAVPPERKIEPRRSVIVVTATFSAILLALLFALLHDLFRRHSRGIYVRLRDAEVEAARATVGERTSASI